MQQVYTYYMLKSFLWWVLEMVVWFFFFYVIFYTAKNDVNIAWMSFIIVLLGSLGIFASPLTRHLSFWNKVIDEILKKEEEKTKF